MKRDPQLRPRATAGPRGLLLLALLLASACRDAAVDHIEHDSGGAVEPDAAEAEAASRRAGVIAQYRTQHRVFAMQTEVARSLLSDPTLTEEARQQAADRLLDLTRELDEAALAIDALALVVVEQWDAGYTTAQTAMIQLEGAHRDAWDALAVERKLVRPS